MNRKPSLPESDASLTRLLEVERLLEERLRAAEAEVRAGLRSAQAALERAEAEGAAAVEAGARSAEAAARVEHEAGLRAIEAERVATLSRLAAVNGAEVDRLARWLLSRLTGEALR